jgi:predicted nucleic acid-binding protein
VTGLVVDTSVWIDFFAGRDVPTLEDALSQGTIILPPIVIAELITGARTPCDRAAVQDLVADLKIADTALGHWVRVGELRRDLDQGGLRVSIPDAHVAQCALDQNAWLLSRDRIFGDIAKVSRLQVLTD